MESVTATLKDLRSSLPPTVQVYWAEIVITVFVGTFIAILCEKISLPEDFQQL